MEGKGHREPEQNRLKRERAKGHLDVDLFVQVWGYGEERKKRGGAKAWKRQKGACACSFAGSHVSASPQLLRSHWARQRGAKQGRHSMEKKKEKKKEPSSHWLHYRNTLWSELSSVLIWPLLDTGTFSKDLRNHTEQVHMEKNVLCFLFNNVHTLY